VYDITVGFNPAVLSFNSVVYGDPVLGDQLDLFGLGSLMSTTTGTGSVELFEFSFDGVDDLNNLQAHDFILAASSYDTFGAGTSPLTFLGVVLGDANGDSLRVTTSDSRVIVEGVGASPVPEPYAIMLVALGLWLMAWKQGEVMLP